METDASADHAPPEDIRAAPARPVAVARYAGVLLAAAAAAWVLGRAVARPPPPPGAGVSEIESFFASVADALPPSGEVGLLFPADTEPSLRTEQHYLAQYAWAPRVVRPFSDVDCTAPGDRAGACPLATLEVVVSMPGFAGPAAILRADGFVETARRKGLGIYARRVRP